MANPALTELDEILRTPDSIYETHPQVRFDEICEIDLSERKLTVIPKSVFILTQLQQLSVSRNELSSIPEEISQLTMLHSLYLHQNMLDSLPQSISKLLHLHELYLHRNKIVYMPSVFAQMLHLQTLTLAQNEISLLPDSMSNLSNLHDLHLHCNRLYYLPEWIGLLSNLKTLRLRENRLKFLPASMSSLIHLSRLEASHNAISEIPSSFSNLSQLKEILLSRNQISAIPEAIYHLTNLATVEIQFNHVSSISPLVSNLTALKTFNAQSNHISELPDGFSSLRNLRDLSLVDNKFPAGVDSIWSCFFFDQPALNLENEGLQTAPHILSFLTHLKVLSLAKNSISYLPDFISTFTSLQSLNVSNNKLTNIPSWIGDLQNLRELKAEYNKLSIFVKPGSFIDEDENIGDNQQQSVLKLDPPSIPPEICKLPKCTIGLIGNKGIPPQFMKVCKAEITESTSNPIEKALKILRIIHAIPNYNPSLANSFETFACKSLAESWEKDQASSIDVSSITGLAVNADAYDLMGMGVVWDSVKRRWNNDSELETYLMEEKGLISWWETGYFTGIALFLDAIKVQGRRFLNSVKAKYLLSVFLYAIFVCLVTVYAITMNSAQSTSCFYFTDAIRSSIQSDQVTTSDTFIDYFRATLLPAVYLGPSLGSYISSPWQANDTASTYGLVTSVRLRQIRSKSKPCSSLSPSPYELSKKYGKLNTNPMCYRIYSSENEDQSAYGPYDAYQWSSQDELQARKYYGPTKTIYPGSGFAQYLPMNFTEASQEFDDLIENNWIDMQTRAVFVEYSASNDNMNTVTFATHIFEFPGSGAVMYDEYYITSPKAFLDSSINSENFLIIPLFIFVIGFILNEKKQYSFLGLQYFYDTWNYFDIVIILLYLVVFSISLCIISMDITTYDTIDAVDSFLKIQNIFFLSEVLRQVYAFLVGASWIRLLSYFSIHPSIGPLLMVIVAMTWQIAKFYFILGIFSVAFLMSFISIYGSTNVFFANTADSSFSIFKFMLGDIDFDALVNLNNGTSVIIVILFYFTFIILLLNFLIAILSGIYEAIHQDSERKFRKLFIETLVSVERLNSPPPLNLLDPLWTVVGLMKAYRLSNGPDIFKGGYMFELWGNPEGDFSDLNPFSPYWPLLGKMWTQELREKQDLISFSFEFLSFFMALTFAYLFSIIWPLTVVGTIHFAFFGSNFEDTKKVLFTAVYYLFWFVTLLPWSICHYSVCMMKSFYSCICCQTASYIDPSGSLSSMKDMPFKKGVREKPVELAIQKQTFPNRSEMETLLKKKIQSVYHSPQITRITQQRISLIKEVQKVSIGRNGSIVLCRSLDTACLRGVKHWVYQDIVGYFEVQVLIPGVVTIGLIPVDYSGSHQPGWNPPSTGFHSDDGVIYPASPSISETFLWNKPGQVAGCGIDYQKKVIFFTLNGHLLPQYYPLPIDKVLYPACGVRYRGSSGLVNFGRNPFAFVSGQTSSTQVAAKNHMRDSKIGVVNVQMNGLVLSYTSPHMKRNDFGISDSVLAVNPWVMNEARIHYFEAEIIGVGVTRQISVGLAPESHNPHSRPGLSPFSLAMSLEGRNEVMKIYMNLGDVTSPTLLCSIHVPNIPYGGSMHFGVGMDTMQQKVFFVINNRILHKYTQDVDCSLLPPLYPVVCLDSHGQLVSLDFDIAPPDLRAYHAGDEQETVAFSVAGFGVGSMIGSNSDMLSEQRSVFDLNTRGEAGAEQENAEQNLDMDGDFEIGDMDENGPFSASSNELHVEPQLDDENVDGGGDEREGDIMHDEQTTQGKGVFHFPMKKRKSTVVEKSRLVPLGGDTQEQSALGDEDL